MNSTISNKAVLVVGDCGFLGHHVVSQLLESHALVSVLDFKLDRNRVHGVEYHSADISIKANVETVLATVRPQVIIHTVSPVTLSTNTALYRVNVDGTRNLLECARSIKTVKAFIYTSSASVVHDSISDLIDADEFFTVLYLPDQKEIYSHTKALAEDLVRAANGSGDGMLTVCLRPAGIFSEGDPNTLRKMIENAQTGKNRFQIGSGKNLFDWTYVGNVARTHILAAEALLFRSSSVSGTTLPRVDGEAFFITNGDPMPFWDFVRAIGDAAGFPVDRKDAWVIPQHVGLALAMLVEWIVWATSLGKQASTMTPGGIRYSCLTRTYRIDKARTRLGYNPTVDMNEGIRRGFDWWLAEKTKKSQ